MLAKEKKRTLARLKKYKPLAEMYDECRSGDESDNYGGYTTGGEFLYSDCSAPAQTCLSIFRKKGFKMLNSYQHTYLNKKNGVVIKNGTVTTSKPPYCAIPTMFVGGIRVQPAVKVDRASVNKARDILFGDLGGFQGDDHSGNIGMWKDIPVAFDW